LSIKALEALINKIVIFKIISLKLFLVVYKETIKIKGLKLLIGLISLEIEYYKAIY
jgi:hypothetical protein